MRWLVAGLCLLAAACWQGEPASDPVAAKAAPARPALWRIRDDDTTIYLFGTIHTLPPGADWKSPAVDAALAGSRAVYFEADVEGDPAVRTALVRRLGLLDGRRRLSDLLSPEQALALRAAAGRVGYSFGALEEQRPWFAAISLADAAIRSAGFSADNGVEAVLRRAAEAEGKDVRFLETMESQLRTLADLPEPVQVDYLAYTLADMEGVAASLAEMLRAWREGDTATLERLLIDQDIARVPPAHEALLTRRNKAWADELLAMLEGEPGQLLVATGMAHFLGGNSVFERLRSVGIVAERVQ